MTNPFNRFGDVEARLRKGDEFPLSVPEQLLKEEAANAIASQRFTINFLVGIVALNLVATLLRGFI